MTEREFKEQCQKRGFIFTTDPDGGYRRVKNPVTRRSWPWCPELNASLADPSNAYRVILMCLMDCDISDVPE